MRIVAGFGISHDAAYVAILQYILATYTHNIHASAMFNLISSGLITGGMLVLAGAMIFSR